ncbi:hypothetical protein [Staphylococcus aureus]|nr:hypothetical protein [Staphylococcus aureus]
MPKHQVATQWILLLKLAEQMKGQPQWIANVSEPAQITSSPNAEG